MDVAPKTEPDIVPWKRLKAVLSPERDDLGVLLFYGIGAGILSLVVPVTAQALVNTAAFGTVLQPVVILALVVFLLLAMAGVMRVLKVAATERLQRRIFARMAVDLAHRLPRVRPEIYNDQRGTELVNRFMDVMTIQKATGLILMDGLALALQAVIGLVLLAFYSPFLLGFDLLLLSSMAFILFGLGRGAVRTSVAESYRKYEVVAWLEELARVPRLSGDSPARRWRCSAQTKRPRPTWKPVTTIIGSSFGKWSARSRCKPRPAACCWAWGGGW